MADPLRIFVSSTSEDLEEYREAAREAILGIEQMPLVEWSADPRSGTSSSLSRVRRSDVLILIVAHRYGHVPTGSTYSVTEQEYREARAAGVPVLAFFLDPTAPWPPDQVEWEVRDRLAAFRALVESEVTRKQFRSAADLAVQVVQALALLDRSPASDVDGRFTGPGGVRQVALPAALRADPDVLIPIGTAEDGLPLVLDVRRGRDLSGPLDSLAQAVMSPGRPLPTALFDTFRQSLIEHANQTWAEDRIEPVLVDADDTVAEPLYVSSFRLSTPFVSILAGLVDQSRVRSSVSRFGPVPRAAVLNSVINTSAGSAGGPRPIPSTGGSNRFLGVSPEDGRMYSVGWLSDGRLTRWRPFVPESVLTVFPDAVIVLDAGAASVTGPLAEAQALLMSALHDHPRDPDGRLMRVSAVVEVSTRAVVAVVADVARRLHDLHGSGRAHGDVKPPNILLTTDGVTLIDSFDVRFGHPSPGWTPYWSAPEQVLGLPVTPATDIHPLAVLLGVLLSGEMVGEVRTYAMPGYGVRTADHRVFHDPALHLDPDAAGLPVDGVRAWRALVERGLRFDPDRRQASLADFATEVEQLAAEYPVSGRRRFRPSGQLVAARLTDGRDALVRSVLDQADTASARSQEMIRPTEDGWL